MKTGVLEKLFTERFPEYVVYGKPLEHYFDFFRSGYELAELKIAELEYENEILTRENNQLRGENKNGREHTEEI